MDIIFEHRPGMATLVDQMPFYEFQEYIEILKRKFEKKHKQNEEENKKYGKESLMKDMNKYQPKLPSQKLPSFKLPK